MEYNNLYNEFLELFPEDAVMLNRKAAELSVETSDGMHVMFGTVVVPFVVQLVEKKDADKLKLAFEFFERMATSDDPHISEVLEFTVLEDIVSLDKGYLDCCKSYMGSETRKSCQSVEKYMM